MTIDDVEKALKTEDGRKAFDKWLKAIDNLITVWIEGKKLRNREYRTHLQLEDLEFQLEDLEHELTA